MLFSVHAKKGKTPPKSIKVPRPRRETGKTPPKEQTPPAELARRFGGSRNVVVQYTPKEVD